MYKYSNNQTLDRPLSLEIPLMIDLTSKKLYDPNYITKAQYLNFIKSRSVRFRDDLSSSELRKQESKLDLAEALTLIYVNFYQKQFLKFNHMFPNNKNMKVLKEEAKKFSVAHTSVFKFDNFLYWNERIKMINWVGKIESKLEKYEVLYPFADQTKHFEGKDNVELIRDREKKVEDVICREMGVDFSIFE